MLLLLCRYNNISVSAEDGPNDRQKLATALALLWTVRLGVFLGWRIIKRGSDWRFTKLVQGGPVDRSIPS